MDLQHGKGEGEGVVGGAKWGKLELRWGIGWKWPIGIFTCPDGAAAGESHGKQGSGKGSAMGVDAGSTKGAAQAIT